MNTQLLRQAADAYRSGRIEQAESLANQACQADPSDEQAVLMYSGLLLHRRANEAAEAILIEALSAGLDSGPAKANLALCWSRLDRHAEAAVLAREVTESEPSLVSAWNALAAALLAMGQPEQAELALEQALAVHPDHPALMLLMGHASSAQKKANEADASYRVFDRKAMELARQAESLTLSGRLVEAEHQYRQLVAIQPSNAAAHAGLGRLLLRMARPDEAIAPLGEAIRLNPEDHSSQHFLGLAKGEPAARAHPAYVRALFDDYAEDFDDSLTKDLGYRIPEEMAARLIDYRADLGEVLDLGCGTGLMAEALADRFAAMDGVDLSPKMLRLAEQRGRYRKLHREEIVHFLGRQAQQWTTILAADVLVYIGDLAEFARHLSNRLRPEGWFSFSIELSESEPCLLNPATGRFQHHPDAVDQILLANGFASPRWTMTTIRQESGQRIAGAIGLAQRLNR